MYKDIPNIIQDVLDTADFRSHNSIESILDNDREIRQSQKDMIKERYGIN